MPKFTRAERQYIQGVVSNYSLQRWTDTDIVNYLHKEKQIEITRAMVNNIKNKAEQEAERWYIELKQSSHKLIVFYKDRLDGLLSYQKRLNDILATDGRSEIAVRAIAELHRIEMSIFTLLKEFPEFQLSNGNGGQGKVFGGCTCSTTSMDNRTHSVCRSRLTTWCRSTFNQDWCPNADCTGGLKGNHFKPFDEYYNWVECPDCKQWFKKQEILDRHQQNGCNHIIRQSNALPNTITDNEDQKNLLVDKLPKSVGSHEHEVKPESPVETDPLGSYEPAGLDSEEPIEEEESADIYWSRNKFRPNPRTRIPAGS